MAEELVQKHPLLSQIIQGTTAVPKAIGKLIDTVSDQIGLGLNPVHIRRKAKAEADASVIGATARAEVDAIEAKSKIEINELNERVAERVKRKEQRRQKNIEEVTAKAAHEINDQVVDEPVDQDWVSMFFDNCQDVSNDEMQLVWGRILAGEVAKPGSFSRSTIAFVKTLDNKTAELFTKFCTYLWKLGDNYVPIVREDDYKTESRTIQFAELVKLDSLGLIRFEPLSGFSVTFGVATVNTPFTYFESSFLLSRSFNDVSSSTIDVGKCLITDLGVELSSIAGSIGNMEYRDGVLNYYRSNGWIILGN